MRPERRESRQSDLFPARLDQIVDLGHPLAKLARARVPRGAVRGGLFGPGGRSAAADALMAGRSILKSIHDLSDEALCERWIENPYFQLFCGEEFFQHKTPFDRSSLARWHQRMGEEKLTALIEESLATATRTGAAKPSGAGRRRVWTAEQKADRCALPAHLPRIETIVDIEDNSARAAGERCPGSARM